MYKVQREHTEEVIYCPLLDQKILPRYGHWEVGRGRGREEKQHLAKVRIWEKRLFYLWKLNAVGGELETAREELEKEHISDHVRVVLLIFKSLVPSTQL